MNRQIKDDPRRRPLDRPYDRPTPGSSTETDQFMPFGRRSQSEDSINQTDDSSSSSTSYSYAYGRARRRGIRFKFNIFNWLRRRKRQKAREKRRKLRAEYRKHYRNIKDADEAVKGTASLVESSDKPKNSAQQHEPNSAPQNEQNSAPQYEQNSAQQNEQNCLKQNAARDNENNAYQEHELKYDHKNEQNVAPYNEHYVALENAQNFAPKKQQNATYENVTKMKIPAITEDEEVNLLKSLLKHNEDVLDEYILERISLETLEKWIKEKHDLKHLDDKKTKKVSFEQKVAQNLTTIHETEDHLPFLLAEYVSEAFQSQAFRLFKVYPGCYNVIHMILAQMEDTGNGEKAMKLALVRADRELTEIVSDVVKVADCVRMSRDGTIRFPTIPISIFGHLDVNQMMLLDYVCYVPFINEIGQTIYLCEMWSTVPFCEFDQKLGTAYMIWTGLALNYCKALLDTSKKRQITYCVISLLIMVFQRKLSLEKLIRKILEIIQYIVSADRASLFLIDDTTQQLVSILFDLQFGIPIKETSTIRIPKDSGIAGFIAQSEMIVNIPDAYLDSRFNKSVDFKTGYDTTSILGMPIIIDKKVIGVVELINKVGHPNFNHHDAMSIKLFSEFLSMAIDRAQLTKKIPKEVEIIRCKEVDVKTLVNDCRPTNINLVNFYLDPFIVPVMDKCRALVSMFCTLFDMPDDPNNLEIDAIARFVLTVKKNYRKVTIHNFCHGWAVTQSLYTLLNHDRKQRFNSNQRVGMYIASICHDMGYKNSLPELSPMAAMYTTDMSENYQYKMTLAILQNEDHNILGNLSCKDNKEILYIMKKCMLATDLTKFYSTIDKLKKLLITSDIGDIEFRWQNSEHKELAISIAMIAADLSSSAKPWEIHLKSANIIIEELYIQGDKEIECGLVPSKGMNRKHPNEQNEIQIEFLRDVCIPCYDVLKCILPHTKPLLRMAKNNMNNWKFRADQVADRRKRLQRSKSKIDLDIDDKGEEYYGDDDDSGSGVATPDVIGYGKASVEEAEPQPGPSGLKLKNLQPSEFTNDPAPESVPEVKPKKN